MLIDLRSISLLKLTVHFFKFNCHTVNCHAVPFFKFNLMISYDIPPSDGCPGWAPFPKFWHRELAALGPGWPRPKVRMWL